MDIRSIINLVESISFPPVLKDAWAIAEYVAELSPQDVDEEMIAENYHGAHAVLAMVPLSQLSEGPADNNIPNRSKERRYAKMDLTTMPPLLVEAGVVVDGNHRFRVAKAAGLTEVPCYVIQYRESVGEGAFDDESTYEYGTAKDAAQYASHVWYHGSEGDFDSFTGQSIRRESFRGFWFAENPKLTGYYGPNQYKVKLHFHNPLIVSEDDYISSKPSGPTFWAKKAQDEGHDADIIQDIIDGDTESTVCCVFNPSLVEILGKDLYVDESEHLNELFDSNKNTINWFGATQVFFEVDGLTYAGEFEIADNGGYSFAFHSRREKNFRLAHGNTNDAGAKAIRVFACVVEILLTFLKKRDPDYVKFLGDNDLGKGDLYKRMAKYLAPRAQALGYEVDIFDDEDESSEKDMSSFYIIKPSVHGH